MIIYFHIILKISQPWISYLPIWDFHHYILKSVTPFPKNFDLYFMLFFIIFLLGKIILTQDSNFIYSQINICFWIGKEFDGKMACHEVIFLPNTVKKTKSSYHFILKSSKLVTKLLKHLSLTDCLGFKFLHYFWIQLIMRIENSYEHSIFKPLFQYE